VGEGDFVVAPGEFAARNGAFQIPPFRNLAQALVAHHRCAQVKVVYAGSIEATSLDHFRSPAYKFTYKRASECGGTVWNCQDI
jgi:hypothetical protein